MEMGMKGSKHPAYGKEGDAAKDESERALASSHNRLPCPLVTTY